MKGRLIVKIELFTLLLFISVLVFGLFSSQEVYAKEKKCTQAGSNITKAHQISIGGIDFDAYKFCESIKNGGDKKDVKKNAEDKKKKIDGALLKLSKGLKGDREFQTEHFKTYYKPFIEKLALGKYEHDELIALNKEYPAYIKKATGKKINPEEVKSKEHMAGNLIAAPGVFTSGMYEDVATCEYMRSAILIKNEKMPTDQKNEFKDPDDLTKTVGVGSDTGEKGNAAVAALGKGVAEGFISPEVQDDGYKNEKGIFGVNCSDFGVLKNMSKLYDPVNITNSKAVMNIVYTFQLASIALGVLLTSIFGVYYMTGNETTDPFRFVIKAFLVMMFVYYLPYFAQDILNINNMLVYYIGQESLAVSGEAAMAGGLIAILASVSSVISMLSIMTVFNPAVGAIVLVGVIILLAVIFLFLRPILTLVFWWYFRLVMIIFLVVLGPLFITMMILPKTADFGKKWLMSLIGETFTQTLMVVAIYFAGEILKDTVQLKADFNLGSFGLLIFVYGIIILLAKVPNIAKSLVGGGIDGIGWNDAMSAGKAVSDFAKNAAIATAGAATGRVLQNQMTSAHQEAADIRQDLNDLDAGVGKYAKTKDHEKEGIRSDLKSRQETSTDRIANMNVKRKNYDNAKKFAEDVKTGNFHGGIGRAMDKSDEAAQEIYGAEESERRKNNLKHKYTEKAKDDLRDFAVGAPHQSSIHEANEAFNKRESEINNDPSLKDKPEEKERQMNEAKQKRDFKVKYAQEKLEKIPKKIEENRKEFNKSLMDDLNNIYKNDRSLKSVSEQKDAINKAYDELSKSVFEGAGLNADGSQSDITNFDSYTGKAKDVTNLDEKANSANQQMFETLPKNSGQFKTEAVEKLLSNSKVNSDQAKSIKNSLGNVFDQKQNAIKTTEQGKQKIADNLMSASQESGVPLERNEALDNANKFLVAHATGNEEEMKAVAEFTNVASGKVTSAVDASKKVSLGVQDAHASLNKATEQFMAKSNGVVSVESASQAVQQIETGAMVMQTMSQANASPIVSSAIQTSLSSGKALDSQMIIETTSLQLQSTGIPSDVATQVATQNVQVVQSAVNTAQSSMQQISSGNSMSWNAAQAKVENALQSSGLSSENISIIGQQAVTSMQDKGYQIYQDTAGTIGNLTGETIEVMDKENYIANSSAGNVSTNIGGYTRNTSAEVLQGKGIEVVVQQIASGKAVDAGYVGTQIGARNKDIAPSVASFASGVEEMVLSATVNNISNKDGGNGDLQGQIFNSFRDNNISYDTSKGALTGNYNHAVSVVKKEAGVNESIAKEYVLRTAQQNASGVSNYENFKFPVVENIIPVQIEEMLITEAIEGGNVLNSHVFQSLGIPQEVEQAISEKQNKIAQAVRKARSAKKMETKE